MIKVCHTCQLEKDHGLNKSTKDGLATRCKECWKTYRDNNKQKVSEGKKASYQKKKEIYNAKITVYYNANREKILEKTKSYVELNRHKINTRNSFRRKIVREQTPDMTPEELSRIEGMYWLARDLRAVSGEEYHVDHIKPLSKGGLHHPDNLQILPADLNLKKSDKYSD